MVKKDFVGIIVRLLVVKFLLVVCVPLFLSVGVVVVVVLLLLLLLLLCSRASVIIVIGHTD